MVRLITGVILGDVASVIDVDLYQRTREVGSRSVPGRGVTSVERIIDGGPTSSTPNRDEVSVESISSINISLQIRLIKKQWIQMLIYNKFKTIISNKKLAKTENVL